MREQYSSHAKDKFHLQWKLLFGFKSFPFNFNCEALRARPVTRLHQYAKVFMCLLQAKPSVIQLGLGRGS